MSTPNPIPQPCETCGDYVRRRADALASAITRAAIKHDVNPKDLATRYMRSVHERHLAGLPLAHTDDPETTS